MRWLIGVFVVGLVAVLAWAVVAQTRWETRCHDAGGSVETRFEYYQTTYVQVGNTQVPQLTPVYSSHCWVDGREVNV